MNFQFLFSFTWKDVGVVPLSRSDDAAITQSHWTEWTATGKKTSTLWDKETKKWKGDDRWKRKDNNKESDLAAH